MIDVWTSSQRCNYCGPLRRECPSPPPDPGLPWGYAEWMALGMYWLHITSVMRGCPSYGSALDAFSRAERCAATDEQRLEAADEQIRVHRLQSGAPLGSPITPAIRERIIALYWGPANDGRSGYLQAVLEYRKWTNEGLSESKAAVDRIIADRKDRDVEDARGMQRWLDRGTRFDSGGRE